MKQERYEIKYIIVSAQGHEIPKYIIAEGKARRDEILAQCKEKGIRVEYSKKLYPFSTMKNQHNFELIRNICFNRMSDIEAGEIKCSEEEYDRLYSLRQKASKYFSYPLPVAWVTWQEYSEMNALAQLAIVHRQEACIEHGRPDLVQYC